VSAVVDSAAIANYLGRPPKALAFFHDASGTSDDHMYYRCVGFGVSGYNGTIGDNAALTANA